MNNAAFATCFAISPEACTCSTVEQNAKAEDQDAGLADVSLGDDVVSGPAIDGWVTGDHQFGDDVHFASVRELLRSEFFHLQMRFVIGGPSLAAHASITLPCLRTSVRSFAILAVVLILHSRINAGTRRSQCG
jgi:hypothetical protein